MQHKDVVALVAGASVGLAGGALGALMAWTAGEAALYRVLVQPGDHYIELRQAASSPARQGQGDRQGSPGSASTAQSARNQSLLHAGAGGR